MERQRTQERTFAEKEHTLFRSGYIRKGDNNKREQTHGKEAYSREDIRGDVIGCTLMGLA